ncbi:MAG: hypothetical protein JNK55_13550 [Rubrivivax sp.]|nr:hypothetical protein [Rubrivivax sp.]
MPLAEDVVRTRALPPPERLPTLTEVVQLASDPWAEAAFAASAEAGVNVEAARETEPAPAQGSEPPAPPLDEDQITRQVLAALEQRLDGLFEARLREALAPALARAADGLIRDLRPELTQALHDMVHDAVVRALQDAQLR